VPALTAGGAHPLNKLTAPTTSTCFFLFLMICPLESRTLRSCVYPKVQSRPPFINVPRSHPASSCTRQRRAEGPSNARITALRSKENGVKNWPGVLFGGLHSSAVPSPAAGVGTEAAAEARPFLRAAAAAAARCAEAMVGSRGSSGVLTVAAATAEF